MLRWNRRSLQQTLFQIWQKVFRFPCSSILLLRSAVRSDCGWGPATVTYVHCLRRRNFLERNLRAHNLTVREITFSCCERMRQSYRSRAIRFGIGPMPFHRLYRRTHRGESVQLIEINHILTFLITTILIRSTSRRSKIHINLISPRNRSTSIDSFRIWVIQTIL